jgi:hypothetical protein
MHRYSAELASSPRILYTIVLYLSEKELMNSKDIGLLLEIIRRAPVLRAPAEVYRAMPRKNDSVTLGPFMRDGHVNFNISFSMFRSIALDYASKDHHPICCLERYCIGQDIPVFAPKYLQAYIANKWKDIQRYALDHGKYPLPDRLSSDTDILRTLDADQEVMICDAEIVAAKYDLEKDGRTEVLTRKGFLQKAAVKHEIKFETQRHFKKPEALPSELSAPRKSITKLVNVRQTKKLPQTV